MKITAKLALFLCLITCSIQAQTITENYPFKLSKTGNSNITVLEEGMKPTAAYVKLGTVKARVGELTGTRYLLAKLKEEAGNMGANAVLDVKVYEETVNLGVGLVDALLSESSAEWQDRIKTYKVMEARAIRYISTIKTPTKLLQAERFFFIGADTSLHADIELKYDVYHQNIDLSFASKKAEEVYDEYLSPYSQFHLFEQVKNTVTSTDSYGRLMKKKWKKLDGSLIYKKINIRYWYSGSIHSIKITHIPDQLYAPSQTQKIRYCYENGKYKPTGRIIYKKDKKMLVTEQWQYDAEGKVVAKQYFYGKSKTAFMFCELLYLSENEWKNVVASYTVHP